MQRVPEVHPHEHEFVEIATVMSGSGIHYTVQGARRIRSGDVLILAPGQWHDFVADSRLEVFNCCFDADLIDSEFRRLAADPALSGWLPAWGHRTEIRPAGSVVAVNAVEAGAGLGAAVGVVGPDDAVGVVRADDAVGVVGPDDAVGVVRADGAVGVVGPDGAVGVVAAAATAGAATGPTHLWLPPRALRSCRAILDGLEQATAPGEVSRIDAVGYLMLFLGHLSRSALPPTRSDRPKPGRGIVAEAVRMLEADPRHGWSLAELASLLAVDRYHLCRCFKAQMGLPPMAYLADYRAHLAASLLRETGWPIARVGAEVGWADANYFARRFRSHFGQSPSAYRAEPAIGKR